MSEKNAVATISDAKNESQQKNPLVFISHDTKDAELAEAFSKLLSAVSCGVLKSFRSSDKRGTQGIEYGVEWYPEIMKKLDDATDVVCLLTKNSLERPWILFEAGVAKGKLNTTLLGLAIGIPLKNANNGPFAQFQNCAEDEESLSKLVFQLVKKVPGSEPDIDVIKTQVGIFLKKTSTPTKEMIKKEDQESPEMHETSVAKLFEEIKVMYTELPEKIGESFAVKRKMSRRNPRIIDDLIHYTNNKKTAILLLLSTFKEDLPWIYDIGYDLLYENNSELIKSKFRALGDIIEYTLHGPISMEVDSSRIRNYLYMLLDLFNRYCLEKEEEERKNTIFA